MQSIKKTIRPNKVYTSRTWLNSLHWLVRSSNNYEHYHISTYYISRYYFRSHKKLDIPAVYIPFYYPTHIKEYLKDIYAPHEFKPLKIT